MIHHGLARALCVIVLAAAFTVYPSGDRGDPAVAAQGDPSDAVDVPGHPAINGDDETLIEVVPGLDDVVTLYEASSGDAVWRGSLPFDAPIAYPHAAAVGDGAYAIVGVPCAEVERMEDSGPVCGPGGVSAAIFDSNTRAWDVIQSDLFPGETQWLQILGVHDGAIVAQVGTSIVLIPTDGSSPVRVSDPPLDGFTACMAGNQVAVVNERFSPGDPSPEPGEWVWEEWRPFTPFESAVLDLDTNVWTPTGGPNATYSEPQFFATGCAGDSVLAVPRKSPSEASEAYVTHRFDIQTGSWAEEAPPGEEFSTVGKLVWTGEELALFVTTAEANRTLTFSADGRWSSTVGGQGAEVQSAAVAGGRLVTLGRDEIEPVFSGPDGRLPEFDVSPLPSSLDGPPEVQAQGPPINERAESVATLDIRVHEFNMCGVACYEGNALPSLLMLELFNFSGSQRPWTVALNEVCLGVLGGQLGTLWEALEPLGYSLSIYIARSDVPDCGGQLFGNVVFNLGPRQSFSSYAYSVQDTQSPEVRGVVCAQNGSFLGDWVGCSTHLVNAPGANEPNEIAAQQANELFSVLAFTTGSMFRIVGGDFNLTPNFTPEAGPPTFNQWRANYLELDEFPPYQATISDGRKIDYIWALDIAQVLLAINFDLMAFPGQPTSDHLYYRGLFSFEI